jgi:hypothetical protein
MEPNASRGALGGAGLFLPSPCRPLREQRAHYEPLPKSKTKLFSGGFCFSLTFQISPSAYVRVLFPSLPLIRYSGSGKNIYEKAHQMSRIPSLSFPNYVACAVAFWLILRFG